MEVLTQACPGLVEHVEAGDLSSASTRALVEQYLRPVLEKGADTIVLGCTHYPFVRDAIQEVAGPGITIIDSAGPVARELRRRLQATELLAAPARSGSETFWTSGSADRVRHVIAQLWGHDVDVRTLPTVTVGRVHSAETR